MINSKRKSKASRDGRHPTRILVLAPAPNLNPAALSHPSHARFRAFATALALILAIVLGFASPSLALEWRSLKVTYTAKPHPRVPQKKVGKDGKQEEKRAAVTIKIPADLTPGEALRGVMQPIRGLEDFAHQNRIALYEPALPPGGLYGLPPREMLDAAAKATGHPELAQAGAILQGLSARGRVRAHAAHWEPQRVIAVILDHTWTPPAPTPKVETYHPSQLPPAAGVPLFFNASRKNKFQGFDRRALNHAWCTVAHRKFGQPCTAVIHHQDVGHMQAGSRDLQAVWLEEVLALRVPAKIPADGSAYQITPVDPCRTGWLVRAALGKDAGGVTIHTDVTIEPAAKGRAEETNFWLPGPRSAKMYSDWVQKTGGTIAGNRVDEFLE